ncbi:MAPEG family protein [Moraxella nasovis]|uniref:MAPEG family protein n=1 Tax=Moraxella nasovis TaxID=2904121 RepID=UPI001F604182|nr:MAPEG family protein [Moraxella nasovis]UNU73852.1 MAPEG family protein [Moraxella nasovis]
MSAIVSNFPHQLSIIVILVAIACLQPLLFALIAKMAGNFKSADNANPREFFAKATGMTARLNAAQQNSFEGLPIFLAAVLLGMYCFVPQNIINFCACCYVVLRFVYAVCYAFNLALLRSAVWVMMIMICCQLFYFSYVMIR